MAEVDTEGRSDHEIGPNKPDPYTEMWRDLVAVGEDPPQDMPPDTLRALEIRSSCLRIADSLEKLTGLRDPDDELDSAAEAESIGRYYAGIVHLRELGITPQMPMEDDPTSPLKTAESVASNLVSSYPAPERVSVDSTLGVRPIQIDDVDLVPLERGGLDLRRIEANALVTSQIVMTRQFLASKLDSRQSKHR